MTTEDVGSSAALRTEYRDRQGWSGELYLPEREMRTMLLESLRRMILC
jgi:hypothetical protein